MAENDEPQDERPKESKFRGKRMSLYPGTRLSNDNLQSILQLREMALLDGPQGSTSNTTMPKSTSDKRAAKRPSLKPVPLPSSEDTRLVRTRQRKYQESLALPLLTERSNKLASTTRRQSTLHKADSHNSSLYRHRNSTGKDDSLSKRTGTSLKQKLMAISRFEKSLAMLRVAPEDKRERKHTLEARSLLLPKVLTKRVSRDGGGLITPSNSMESSLTFKTFGGERSLEKTISSIINLKNESLEALYRQTIGQQQHIKMSESGGSTTLDVGGSHASSTSSDVTEREREEDYYSSDYELSDADSESAQEDEETTTDEEDNTELEKRSAWWRKASLPPESGSEVRLADEQAKIRLPGVLLDPLMETVHFLYLTEQRTKRKRPKPRRGPDHQKNSKSEQLKKSRSEEEEEEGWQAEEGTSRRRVHHQRQMWRRLLDSFRTEENLEETAVEQEEKAEQETRPPEVVPERYRALFARYGVPVTEAAVRDFVTNVGVLALRRDVASHTAEQLVPGIELSTKAAHTFFAQLIERMETDFRENTAAMLKARQLERARTIAQDLGLEITQSLLNDIQGIKESSGEEQLQLLSVDSRHLALGESWHKLFGEETAENLQSLPTGSETQQQPSAVNALSEATASTTTASYAQELKKTRWRALTSHLQPKIPSKSKDSAAELDKRRKISKAPILSSSSFFEAPFSRPELLNDVSVSKKKISMITPTKKAVAKPWEKVLEKKHVSEVRKKNENVLGHAEFFQMLKEKQRAKLDKQIALAEVNLQSLNFEFLRARGKEIHPGAMAIGVDAVLTGRKTVEDQGVRTRSSGITQVVKGTKALLTTLSETSCAPAVAYVTSPKPRSSKVAIKMRSQEQHDPQPVDTRLRDASKAASGSEPFEAQAGEEKKTGKVVFSKGSTLIPPVTSEALFGEAAQSDKNRFRLWDQRRLRMRRDNSPPARPKSALLQCLLADIEAEGLNLKDMTNERPWEGCIEGPEYPSSFAKFDSKEVINLLHFGEFDDRLIRVPTDKNMREFQRDFYRRLAEAATKRRSVQLRTIWKRCFRRIQVFHSVAQAIAQRSLELESKPKTYVELGDLDYASKKEDKEKSVGVENYKRQKCISISSEVKTTLTTLFKDRTLVMVEKARRELNKVEIFSHFPIDVQEHIIRRSFYMEIGPDRVILRQGHIPRFFYFIISGEAFVKRHEYNAETGERYVFACGFIRDGETFGGFALVSEATRTSSVISRSPMQLLALDGDDYLSIFVYPKLMYNKLPLHIYFISQLSFMEGFPTSILLEKSSLCTLHHFKRNTVISHDSKHSTNLFVVKYGYCKVFYKLDRIEPQRQSRFAKSVGLISNDTNKGKQWKENKDVEKKDSNWGHIQRDDLTLNASKMSANLKNEIDPSEFGIPESDFVEYYETRTPRGLLVHVPMTRVPRKLDPMENIRLCIPKYKRKFVPLALLKDGDVFGLDQTPLCPRMEESRSTILVSLGAEVIALNKDLYCRNVSCDYARLCAEKAFIYDDAFIGRRLRENCNRDVHLEGVLNHVFTRLTVKCLVSRPASASAVEQAVNTAAALLKRPDDT